jgi:DNA repair protein SbcC/Rad50
MKLHKLRMKAFGTYAEEQILDFTELKENKMFLIHGQTGAGKTSILDGITFALYGETSGSYRKGKELRSHFANPKDDTEIELVFSVRGKTYRIERKPEQEVAKKNGNGTTIKSAEAKLYLVKISGEDFISDRIDVVKEEIVKIIGFDCNQFKQVIILPQGEFRKFLEAKSSEKEDILNKLFKTEKYTRLESFLSDKNKSVNFELESLSKELSSILKNSGFENIMELEKNYEVNKNILLDKEKEIAEINKNLQNENLNLGKILEDNKKINEKEFLLEKQKKLDSQKFLFDEKEKNFLLSRKALPIFEIEKNILKIKEEKSWRENEKNRIENDLNSSEIKLKEINDLFENISLRKKDFDIKRNEIVLLNKKRSKVEEFSVLKNKEIQIKKIFSAKDSELIGSKNQLEKIKNHKKELNEKIKIIGDYGMLWEERENARTKQRELISTKGLMEKNIILKKELESINNLLVINEKSVLEAESELNILKKEYEILFSSYEKSIAYNLSSMLKENVPCPVCGSLNHPDKACKPERFCDKEILDKKKKNISQKEDVLNEENRRFNNYKIEESGKKSEIENNNKSLNNYATFTIDEITKMSSENEKLGFALKSKIEEIEFMKKEIQKCDDEETKLIEKINILQTEYDKIKSEQIANKTLIENAEKEIGNSEFKDIEILNKYIKTKNEEIVKFDNEFKNVTDKSKLFSENLEVAKNSFESSKIELRKIIEKLQKENNIFNANLKESGFNSFEEYEKRKMDEKSINILEIEINNYKTDINTTENLLKKILIETKDLEKKDEEDLEKSLNKIELNLKEKQEKFNILNVTLDKQKTAIETYKSKIFEYDGKLVHANIVNDICDCIRPKSGIPLRTYVLLSFLDEVLEAANKRLVKMSRNRFYLKRREEFTGGGYKGLEIDVFDSETGKDRAVGTLSGGEGFLASLSLALGLADVVQNYAGGIELDSIFIDEGFGSLDSQTLDSAIKTIMEINQKGRLVGIISHVEELRERFNDCRLEVKKTSNGSVANFYVV